MNVGSVEVLLTLRDRLSAELAKPSSNLVKLAGEVRRTELALNKLDDGNTRAARSTRGFGDQVRTTLVHVAAAAAAYKALAAASQSVINQVEFVRTFEKIENITGITRAEVDKLRSSINALSSATGKGPQELAEGFYFIASAGLKGAQATEVLTQAAKASAVGLGETKDIAKSITAVLNAYGAENISAAQAANQLFVAVREGGAEASEVAGVFGRIVGISKEMGVSFAEVGASVATFTRVGVGADEAVTALRGTLSTLLKPDKQSREAIEGLAGAFGRVTMSAADLRQEIKDRGLADVLITIVKATNGNVEALGHLFPNIRSLAGVLANAGSQADAYREILGKMTTDTTALADGFTNVSQSASFKWDQLKAQFQQLSLTLGAALLPGVQAFAAALASIDPSELHDLGTSVATSLSALGEILKVVIAHFDAFKAVVTGLILLKFGAALSAWVAGLGTASVAAETATGTFAVMGTSISAIAAPIAIAVSALLFLSNKAKEYSRDTQKEIEDMVRGAEAAGKRLEMLRGNLPIDIDAERAAVEESRQLIEKYNKDLDRMMHERFENIGRLGFNDRRIKFLDEEIAKTQVLITEEELRNKQAGRLVDKWGSLPEQLKRIGTGLTDDVAAPIKLADSATQAFAQRLGEVTTKLQDQLAAAKADLEVARARQAQMSGAIASARELSLQARTQLEVDKAIASLESNKHKLTAATRAEVTRLVAEWMRVKDETKNVLGLIEAQERATKFNLQFAKELTKEVEKQTQALGDQATINARFGFANQSNVAGRQLKQTQDIIAAYAEGGDLAARALQIQLDTLEATNGAVKLTNEQALALAKVADQQDRLNYLAQKFAELSKPTWKIYLDAAFSAIDAVGNALTDVIVQAGMTGKVEWKNIWESLKQSLLQIFAEMLAEMLKRWIATQLAMRAASQSINAGGASGSSTGGGIPAGGGGGISGLQGFGGETGGAALMQYAAIAYGLFVVYKAFIEDHSRHFGSVTIGTAGDLQSVVGNSQRHMQAAQQAALALIDSLKKWMTDIDVAMASFASVTIEHTGPGFGVSSGSQIIGMFATAEEAISAAQAFMIRFGEFAESVPSLIQAAIRGTSELSMDAITSNIEFARTLLTQNLSEVEGQITTSLETFMSQIRRSLQLFSGADLVQATDSAILHFASSLHDLYNTLTGHKDDPKEAAERQRQAYNLQRTIIIAQITLLMEEVRARIAAVQAHVLYLQRTGGVPPGLGWGPGGGGGQAGGGTGFGFGTTNMPSGGIWKGGGAFIQDNRNPTNDPQLAALLQVLDNLARALQGLPPEIAPGGVHIGGGGGRGGARDQARDFIAQREFDIALQGMSEFQRQLAQIRKEYDDQLEQLGKHSAERQRLLELEAQEIALATQRYQEDVRNRVDELTGVGNAFTKLHKQFSDLRTEILAAGYGAQETADMIARLTQAEADAVRLLSDQMAGDLLGGLASYIDDVVVKQELLRQQSIIKFNLEMAQFRAQFELLRAQGLLSDAAIAAIEGALSWMASHSSLLPGGYGAGGAPGFNPFANVPGTPAFNPGTQLASGQWSNVYVANGHSWAWYGSPMDGHWVDLGAAPGGGGGSGGGDGGGVDPNAAWIAARKRALELLEQYRNQGLDRWHAALKKLNDDFDIIRRALGNTPEVAQAYANALAHLREEFLSGIREFYDSMLTGPGSPLTTEQKFNQARANYQRLLALVQGGDLSQADALRQAAAEFQSLAAQMFGTSTGGYSAIFDQIRTDLAALLGINLGGTGNVIGGPQWFAQGSAAQVTAIGNAGQLTVASISGLSNVVDMASYRQEAILERIVDELVELRAQGGTVANGGGGGNSVVIGATPSRSTR